MISTEINQTLIKLIVLKYFLRLFLLKYDQIAWRIQVYSVKEIAF